MCTDRRAVLVGTYALLGSYSICVFIRRTGHEGCFVQRWNLVRDPDLSIQNGHCPPSRTLSCPDLYILDLWSFWVSSLDMGIQCLYGQFVKGWRDFDQQVIIPIVWNDRHGRWYKEIRTDYVSETQPMPSGPSEWTGTEFYYSARRDIAV